MGCWGMGLTQSDEFCEIYEIFMELYNQGKSVSDISKEILAKYHKEHDNNDEVMHDIYFALAKAEWMCCEQSPYILQRVKEIIESGANLDFYHELGADAHDLKLRKKNLIAFYKQLKTPRQKPKKRCPPPKDDKKQFPPINIGDCYAYKYGNGKRIAVILDRFQLPEYKEQILCCILKSTYNASEVKKINFLEQEVGYIGGYIAPEFLVKSAIHKVGTIKVPANANSQIFGENQLLIGNKKDFKKDYSNASFLKLSQLLETKYEPNKKTATQEAIMSMCIALRLRYDKPFSPDIKRGDVFSIKSNNKYRIFTLTQQKLRPDYALMFCYLWRNTFDEIPSYEQLFKSDVIPLGWFTSNNFPEAGKLTKLGNYPVLTELIALSPEELISLSPENINLDWKPSAYSYVFEKNLFEEYPANLCMPLEKALEKSNSLINELAKKYKPI